MKHNLLMTISRYSILESVRDKFLLFIILGELFFFCMSLFIGELTITETSQTQAAILASLLRLFTIFTMGLFVITSMVREFNDKGFELILSHPIPRSTYYFGKFIGFSMIALLISLISMSSLIIYSPYTAVLSWSISLFCEMLIIISLSLLCLFSFSSVTISFTIVIAFYIFSRTIDAILLISDSPILALGSISHKFINELLHSIAFIIPELYRFTDTRWLIYPFDPLSVLPQILLQTLIYTTLLSSAALFDLYRKEL